MPGAIDFEAAETQRLLGRWRAAPAQDRAQPREQFARLEGFGQIVVRAELESDDAIGCVAARGQHQHGRVALRAQRAADIETVDIGQGQIEDDRIVVGARTPRECDVAVRGDGNAKTGLAQILAQHRGEARVVFDQEQMFHARHSSIRAWRAAPECRSYQP